MENEVIKIARKLTSLATGIRYIDGKYIRNKINGKRMFEIELESTTTVERVNELIQKLSNISDCEINYTIYRYEKVKGTVTYMAQINSSYRKRIAKNIALKLIEGVTPFKSITEFNTILYTKKIIPENKS